jgi:hypothetical protein
MYRRGIFQPGYGLRWRDLLQATPLSTSAEPQPRVAVDNMLYCTSSYYTVGIQPLNLTIIPAVKDWNKVAMAIH